MPHDAGASLTNWRWNCA